MTRLAFILICLIGTSVSVSAEMFTYRFDGIKDSDGIFGLEGSPVVGFFSYDTGLQKTTDLPYQARYASVFPFTQADLHFQILYQDHNLYTTTHPRLDVFNNYGLDPSSPNSSITIDMLNLSSSHMVSPTIGLPPAFNVEVLFHDIDSTVFDSTDLPVELPPIDLFERAFIYSNAGIAATITALSRINNGDLDGDGFVGINDLNTVLSNWNQAVTFGDRLSGEPSGDGFVGIQDLNLVLGNWNAGTPPQSASPSPEPASLTLLGVGAMVMFKRPHTTLPCHYKANCD